MTGDCEMSDHATIASSAIPAESHSETAVPGPRARHDPTLPLEGADPDRLHRLPAAADLLARQHELQDEQEILGAFTLWPQHPTLRNYAAIFTDPSWYNGYINSIIYV